MPLPLANGLREDVWAFLTQGVFWVFGTEASFQGSRTALEGSDHKMTPLFFQTLPLL